MATLRKLPARAYVVPMGRAYVVKAEFHAQLGWAARIQTWFIHDYGARTFYGRRTRWKLQRDEYVRELAANRLYDGAIRSVSEEQALALGEARVQGLLKRYQPEQIKRGSDVAEFAKGAEA